MAKISFIFCFGNINPEDPEEKTCFCVKYLGFCCSRTKVRENRVYDRPILTKFWRESVNKIMFS